MSYYAASDKKYVICVFDTEPERDTFCEPFTPVSLFEALELIQRCPDILVQDFRAIIKKEGEK